MNRTEWRAHLTALNAASNSYQFEVGDSVCYGVATWGSDACFEDLQQLTGKKNTRNFYRRCAVVSALYPASLRYPTLTFSVYEALRHFPIEWLSNFLPTVKDSGRSCRQILHLAIEQFGTNPALYKKRRKRHPVSLDASVYHAACERAKAENTHVQFWIEKILETHLAAAQSAGKSAPGVAEASGNDADDSSPRPTYAERRRAQKAAKRAVKQAAAQQRSEKAAVNKAARLAAREKRESEKLAAQLAKAQRVEELKAAGKFKTKIEIAFVACKGCGGEFVDTENGTVQIPKMKQRATSFRSFEDALAGAREYSEAKRYVVIPYLCPRCSNGRPIWHLRYPDEVDLSKECAEVRATVQDFIQSTRASLRQHAKV